MLMSSTSLKYVNTFFTAFDGLSVHLLMYPEIYQSKKAISSFNEFD